MISLRSALAIANSTQSLHGGNLHDSLAAGAAGARDVSGKVAAAARAATAAAGLSGEGGVLSHELSL